MKIEKFGEIEEICVYKICSKVNEMKKIASMTSPVASSVPVLVITLPSSVCLPSFNTWHHIPTYTWAQKVVMHK